MSTGKRENNVKMSDRKTSNDVKTAGKRWNSDIMTSPSAAFARRADKKAK